MNVHLISWQRAGDKHWFGENSEKTLKGCFWWARRWKAAGMVKQEEVMQWDIWLGKYMQQHSEWEKNTVKQKKNISVHKWKYLGMCGCSGNTRSEECHMGLFILGPREIRTKNGTCHWRERSSWQKYSWAKYLKIFKFQYMRKFCKNPIPFVPHNTALIKPKELLWQKQAHQYSCQLPLLTFTELAIYFQVSDYNL